MKRGSGLIRNIVRDCIFRYQTLRGGSKKQWHELAQCAHGGTAYGTRKKIKRDIGGGSKVKPAIAKEYRYLRDAIIRIQQHLGTLGASPIERSEAKWLTPYLTELSAVQRSYQVQLATKGTVVP